MKYLMILLVLGIWFTGISLWIKPEIANAHRGMNSFELSDFRNAVISVVLRCKARVHGGIMAQDAQIVCYDLSGKYDGNDWIQ